MTSPEPMLREELLELAGLDALGLLDEYEAELFTRSFHYAADTVRDEIIRLQAEIAADDRLLPADDSSKDLRARVLALVAEAIDKESTELAPIATFRNRSRRAEAPDSSGRWRLGPNSFWRAACFALIGAVIAVTYLWSVAAHDANEISKLALMGLTDRQIIDLVGPDVTEFIFDPTVDRVLLSPTVSTDPQRGLILVAPERNQAFLVANLLPLKNNPDYTLSVKLADGTSHKLDTFTSSGGLLGVRLDDLDDVIVSMLATATWQIKDLAGTVLLTSA